MEIKTYNQHIDDFNKKALKINSKLIHFNVNSDECVYNPSIPFVDNGKNVIAARVENGDFSKACFFEESENGYTLIKNAPVFEMEDPFITKIGDELIFGGVELIYDSEEDKKNFNYKGWQTHFYRGKDIFSLKSFAYGPMNMKDIRLVELPDKKIGVFSRPHGLAQTKGYSATIGFCVIDTLDDLCAEVIANARLIETLFAKEEWGGANQIYVLPDGKLGVMGHIASGYFNDKQIYVRHYSSMAFIFDYKNFTHSPLKIVATRSNFPQTTAKAEGLEDVVFTAGIVMGDNDKATLYAGLSDAFVGVAEIENPFL